MDQQRLKAASTELRSLAIVVRRDDMSYNSSSVIEAVERHRRELGLSIARLAKISGLTTKRVNRVLEGIGGAHASADLLDALCQYLDEEIDVEVEDASASVEADRFAEVSGWYQSSSVAREISTLAETLKVLLSIIRQSNEIGANGSSIDPIERAQLVALLEATLSELKAPVIDGARLTVITKWLKKIGLRAAEKNAEDAARGMFLVAAGAGAAVLSQLSTMVSSATLPF